MIESRIREAIAENIRIKQTLLEDADLMGRISSAVAVMVDAFANGGRVWFCGNGGSAADAQHLAAELSGRFYADRKPLPAEALHCNTSYLTAVANDYGFEEVYARMVEASARPGDVLVAISTSGNSANVLKACNVAKQLGVQVIALTGQEGGKLAACADILLNPPTTDTPRIQECHILIGHILCELIECSVKR